MTSDTRAPGVFRPRRWTFFGVLVWLGIIVVAAFLRFRSPAAMEAASLPSDTGVSARLTVPTGRASGSDGQQSPDVRPEGLLGAAALASDADRVQELLAEGVTANAQSGGMSALHRAAQADALDVLDLLLDAGAEVMVVDHSGSTPLGRAALFARRNAALRLLEAGADPGLTPGMFSARMLAGAIGNAELAALLGSDTGSSDPG